MTRYVYDQVSWTGRREGACQGCGRHAKREKKFTNTVNPFNRNEDGTARTRAEVEAVVRGLAKEWSAGPVLHARCEQ